MTPRVFIGWDAAEWYACRVAEASIRQRTYAVDVRRLAMLELQAKGWYTRPTSRRDGRLWDDLSDAPMSTTHANARFFLPHYVQHEGWALFMDGDVLVRRDVGDLWALRDERFAVQVVKHAYQPTATEKKAGHVQTAYPRKNWSSVVLWNCAHPAHHALTRDVLNSVPGRDLHRFHWLSDDLIGELPPEWNWLVGHSSPDVEPAIVHFTEGLPDKPGYSDVPYADEWRALAQKCGWREGAA